MTKLQKTCRVLVAHVLNYVTAKNPSESSQVLLQVRAGFLTVNCKTFSLTGREGFGGMVDSDGLDAGCREKFEKYPPTTANIQHWRAITKICNKWLLDAPNRTFGAAEFIKADRFQRCRMERAYITPAAKRGGSVNRLDNSFIRVSK